MTREPSPGHRRGCTPLLALAALLVAAEAPAETIGAWTAMGPRAATVFALERDPFDPAVLYAGTYFGGLYRSQDRGLTWSPMSSDFSTSTVFAVAVDPAAPGTLYVGTLDKGIYKSQDAGVTWAASDETGSLRVHAIVIDPEHHQTVLAATSKGVLRSADGGLTWAVPTGAGPAPSALLFDPAATGLVYLGTSGRGAFLSRDAGLTWTPFGDGMGDRVVTRLEFERGSPGRVLAATGEGVFRTRSDGSGWDDITHDLPVSLVNQAVSDPATGSLYAASDSGVFRLEQDESTRWIQWTGKGARFVFIDPEGSRIHLASTAGDLEVTHDDGRTFQPADLGIQNRFVESLATVNAFGQTVIYAGTDRSVEFTSEAFRSGGELPWAIGRDFGGGIFDVEPRPSATGTLFTGTEGAGVWKTTDFGRTWESASQGIVPGAVLCLDQSPIATYSLYAGTSFGIYTSRDDGLSWTPNTDTTPRPVTAVLADPVRPGVAYYGTGDGEVLRSFDGGANFQRVWEGVGQGIRKLAAARWGKLYAVNAAGQLYASDDLGERFFRRATEIEHEIVAVAVDHERPWTVYVGTVFGGVYKSESDAIQWTQSNTGIDTPIVFSLAIDPGDPATLYAGSLDSVYKSANAGSSWTRLDHGLARGAVTDLRIDPADHRTIYASVNGEGVFQSSDGGAQWRLLRKDAPFLGAVPLAVSHRGAGVVFAGTQGGGVYRSSDRGATWSASNAGLTVFIKDIAVDPVLPTTMYAASLVDGVFGSTDGGTTWASKGLAGRYVLHLDIDRRSSRTLYASTSTGIARSQDGGATWVDLGQRMAYVFAVASDPSDRTIVYAGGFAGELYQSTDAGRNWRRAAHRLPGNVLALAVDPAARMVYASIDQHGVYASVDEGRTWQRPSSTQGIDSLTITSLAVDPLRGHLYAASLGGGLYKSTDAGRSFERLVAGLAGKFVSSVLVDAEDTDVVFASLLSENGVDPALYVSTDAGTTWQASATGLDSGTVFSIAPDPGNGNVLFAAAAAGVYRSADRGASWQRGGSGLAGLAVRQLLVEAGIGGNPSTVYAGTAGQGMYRSQDGGTTWLPMVGPYDGVNVSAFARGRAPGLIYAATLGNGVIYGRSSESDALDGGTDASVSQAFVHMVVIDPLTSTTLYAATGGHGVIKSLDGGVTWRTASQGIDHPFLMALVIDPVEPNTLYAGTTGGGVFVSEDAAATWRPINEGLFHRNVTCLALDANDHRVLYSGTEGGGVFRLRR